jgi:hypothetical protein
MEVGSVLEERKSERVGPVLRLSANVVWGRRGGGGGEMVARHRTEEGEGFDSLEFDSEVVWVCAISL